MRERSENQGAHSPRGGSFYLILVVGRKHQPTGSSRRTTAPVAAEIKSPLCPFSLEEKGRKRIFPNRIPRLGKSNPWFQTVSAPHQKAVNAETARLTTMYFQCRAGKPDCLAFPHSRRFGIHQVLHTPTIYGGGAEQLKGPALALEPGTGFDSFRGCLAMCHSLSLTPQRTRGKLLNRLS